MSLEQIESNLFQIRNEHKATIDANKTELEQIRELMIAKSEIDAFFYDLNAIVKGAFPLLHDTELEQTEE